MAQKNPFVKITLKGVIAVVRLSGLFSLALAREALEDGVLGLIPEDPSIR